jgi:hypothetical protein
VRQLSRASCGHSGRPKQVDQSQREDSNEFSGTYHNENGGSLVQREMANQEDSHNYGGSGISAPNEDAPTGRVGHAANMGMELSHVHGKAPELGGQGSNVGEDLEESNPCGPILKGPNKSVNTGVGMERAMFDGPTKKWNDIVKQVGHGDLHEETTTMDFILSPIGEALLPQVTEVGDPKKKPVSKSKKNERERFVISPVRLGHLCVRIHKTARGRVVVERDRRV